MSRPTQVLREATPRPGVRITWDDLRRTAHQGRHPGRRRASAPGTPARRTGCSCMDVLRHAGAARAAEFLGPTDDNVAMDQEQLRSRVLHRRRGRRPDRRRLPTGSAPRARSLVAAVDAYLAGHQRRPGRHVPARSPVGPECPAEYAALRQDARALGPRRPRLRRVSGRRHLRQGRRRRVRANARWLQQLAGASSARRRPRRIYDDLRERRRPARRRPRRPPLFRYGGGPASTPTAAVSPCPTSNGATAPGTGADAGSSTPVPLPPAPAALPGPGSATGRSVVDGPFGPIAPRSGPRHEQRAARSAPTAPPPATRSPCSARRPATSPRSCSPSRCSRAPGIKARGVSFAGTQPRRPARARPRLRLVGDQRGQRPTWTPSSSGCASPTARTATVESDGATCVDGKCVPMDRRRATRRLATPDRGRPGRAAAVRFLVLRTRARHRPAAHDGRRRAGRDRDPAQHLRPRARLARSASRGSTTRDYVQDAAGFQRRRRGDRLHVQLVLHRRPATSPTTPRAGCRCAPRAPTPHLPRWGDAHVRLAGLARRSEATRTRSTRPRASWSSWNNKQAPGFGPRPTTSGATARSTAAQALSATG